MLLFCEYGGILKFKSVVLNPEEMSVLIFGLNKIYDKEGVDEYVKSIIDNYNSLYDSMNMPRFDAKIRFDTACSYLGYNRKGKTKLIVRIKEAIRVLLGKPSQVFFTLEDGNYATGSFKDAYRVELNVDQLKASSLNTYNCRYSDNYIIPMIKFLPKKYCTNSILKMFCNEVISDA